MSGPVGSEMWGRCEDKGLVQRRAVEEEEDMSEVVERRYGGLE